MVSHGYIVVAINSPFISGDVELPNHHVVKFNPNESENDLMKLPTQDFIFVYKKITNQHNSNAIFKSMDIQHIGAFGHSIGANIVANVAHDHPLWFQAGAALDIGYDKSGVGLKKFKNPFMHLISANRISASKIPVKFTLAKNGYLVGISPNERNHDYSFHMNFTDNSTLQYLPAIQIAMTYYQKQRQSSPFGSGNGWAITSSINTYLLGFFNTYLKGDINSKLTSCNRLTKNTYIHCG